jgi:hypothetical protein
MADKKVSVELSAYDWHMLLTTLERQLSVVNDENWHITVEIYQKIASMLSDKEVLVDKGKANN